MSTFTKSLAPEQRKSLREQVRIDRDIMVAVLKEHPRASRSELEFLYWERGGEIVRFNACLSHAADELLLETPA